MSYDQSIHGRFLPGVILANRYRIVSLAERGGMGEVYRADDLKLGQSVALKFLPEQTSDEGPSFQLFIQEVRLSRQITHLNVCRVYDIGESEGHHFLSMEFIDGENLRALLRRIGSFPPERGIRIAQQICAGLAAAHQRGVLHRDLKPCCFSRLPAQIRTSTRHQTTEFIEKTQCHFLDSHGNWEVDAIKKPQQNVSRSEPTISWL